MSHLWLLVSLMIMTVVQMSLNYGILGNINSEENDDDGDDDENTDYEDIEDKT